MDNVNNREHLEGTYIFPLEHGKELLSSPEKLFIGRRRLRENLTDSLKMATDSRLSVLVGGYRGVGKTLLVESCVNACKRFDKAKKHIRCDINLGVDQKITTFSVLSDLSENLNSSYLDYWLDVKIRLQLCLLAPLLSTSIYLYFSYFPNIFRQSYSIFSAFGSTSFLLVATTIGCAVCFPRLSAKHVEHSENYEKQIDESLGSIQKEVEGKLKLRKSSRHSLILRYAILLILFGICLFDFASQGIISLPAPSVEYSYIKGIGNLFLLSAFPLVFILSSLSLLNLAHGFNAYSNAIYLRRRLVKLVRNIRYSKAMQSDIGIEKGPFKAKYSQTTEREPIKERRIESELINIFQWTKYRHFPTQNLAAGFFLDSKSRVEALRFIIIFDELDKIGILNDEDSNQFDSDSKSRQVLIDQLLSGLKSFVTSANATFIFIAGREAVDSYHSESGNKSALYEGLFDQIYYIPTLLTDTSDDRPYEIHSMIQSYTYQLLLSKKYNALLEKREVYYPGTKHLHVDARNRLTHSEEILLSSSMINWSNKTKHLRIGSNEYYLCSKLNYSPDDDSNNRSKYISTRERTNHIESTSFILRVFVRYLVFHSWGNCRRLTSLIRQFTEIPLITSNESPGKDWIIHGGFLNAKQHYLKFDEKQLMRLLISSHLYSLLESSHARLLSQSDDKLAVSTLITLQDISKFHEIAFSREHLDRTLEGIDIHAEPHLTKMVNELISTTMYSAIRNIRNGVFDFRFFSNVEDNYRYLSRRIGARAASFEFGLDSSEPVRKFYSKHFKVQDFEGKSIDPSSYQAIAKKQEILGDLYMWERSYDESFMHYSNAAHSLKLVLLDKNGKWQHDGAPSFSSHAMLLRILLKQGHLEELRNQLELAWRFYREALLISSIYIAMPDEDSSPTATLERLVRLLESGDVRALEMFINATNSLDILYLKKGKTPRPLTYCLLNKTKLEESAISDSPLDWKPNFDQGAYLKLAIIHFFGQEYSELVNRFRPLVRKTNLDEWDHQFCLQGLLFSQSLIIVEMQKLKDYENTHQIFSVWDYFAQKDEAIFEYNSDSTATLFSSRRPSWSKIFSGLQLLCGIARRLGDIGFHARSAYVYLNVLSIWIAILETAPWRSIEKQKTLRHLDNLTNLIFPEKLLLKIRERIRSSERSAFRGMRASISMSFPREEDFIKQVTLKDYELDPDSEMRQKYHSKSFWYRSSLEKLSLMMSLWESYARRKISDKYSHIYPTSTKYEIGNVPIGGDKSMSISHWIEGRSSQDNLEEEFRLILNNPEILKSDAKLIDLQNLTCEIIGHYYLAMFESDILSQSSIPLTFPPKCHVYYNAWESLRIYYQLAFYFDQCGLDTPSSDYWKNSDKIKAFERKLQLKLRTTNRYVPFSLINYPHIRREAKMALTEFREVGKVSSPSYQHTIRDKYYLFDDFEDPLFKIEWTFVQVLATGSYLHLKEIEE